MLDSEANTSLLLRPKCGMQLNPSLNIWGTGQILMPGQIGAKTGPRKQWFRKNKTCFHNTYSFKTPAPLRLIGPNALLLTAIASSHLLWKHLDRLFESKIYTQKRLCIFMLPCLSGETRGMLISTRMHFSTDSTSINAEWKELEQARPASRTLTFWVLNERKKRVNRAKNMPLC